ncbi:rho guanine nucleotide exchange factor 11-like isoform X3 [Centruroides vittatus]
MVHRTPSGSPADFLSGGTAPAAGVQPVCSNSTIQHYDDSDLEAEADPPNWQGNVDWETIRLLKPKEKKRQDVINELFHTERTHVKNLKILDRIFYKPLLNEGLLPSEFLHLLFPNLEEMLKIHNEFNTLMKEKRKKESIVGNIGEMMLQMFDGTSGENLKQAAAIFCRNQSIALESLKIKQKRDQKLGQFLTDAECNHLCRRLQLKDIVATGFQRLTKYPLLLENIAKYTVPNTEEHSNLMKALECSRQILSYVNQAVKEAENQHRLNEIQKKLDKSALEKVDHPIAHNYKTLDLTKHLLLYEGILTWRLNKQKSIEVHVILLEDILVLLQKQEEKYFLRFHNTNILSGREDTKVAHSPILKLPHLFTRDVATDKRAFFLVSTSDQHAIYEFAAASVSERRIWLRHITEAIDMSKSSINQTHLPDYTSPQINKLACPESSLEDIETNTNTELPSPNDKTLEKNTNENNSKESEETKPLGPEKKEETIPKVPPPSENGEPKKQRRLQRVEILKIADGPELIAPSEVIVRQGAAYQTAEPVLTPIEQLRRKEQQIAKILSEKEKLVAQILQISPEEFEHIAKIVNEMDGNKNVKELLLSAIYQSNQLSVLLNNTLQVTEEDTISASSPEGMSQARTRKKMGMHGMCPEKLLSISMALNKCLTELLSVITEHEEERKQLKTELKNSKEQIHLLHETHRNCSLQSSLNTQNRSNIGSLFPTTECCCNINVNQFPTNEQYCHCKEDKDRKPISEENIYMQGLPSSTDDSTNTSIDHPVNTNS